MITQTELNNTLKVMQILFYVGGGVVAIGAAVFGVKYGFSKAKNTNVEQNTSLLQNLKEQIDAQNIVIARLQQDMKDLQAQNIALQATNVALEKTNAGYLSLFQSTNPSNLQLFMQDVRTFMATHAQQPIINVKN